MPENIQNKGKGADIFCVKIILEFLKNEKCKVVIFICTFFCRVEKFSEDFACDPYYRS
jgi:hypothetical protein